MLLLLLCTFVLCGSGLYSEILHWLEIIYNLAKRHKCLKLGNYVDQFELCLFSHFGLNPLFKGDSFIMNVYLFSKKIKNNNSHLKVDIYVTLQIFNQIFYSNFPFCIQNRIFILRKKIWALVHILFGINSTTKYQHCPPMKTLHFLGLQSFIF